MPSGGMWPSGSKEGDRHRRPRPAPVVLGLEDLPATQTQRPATFDVVDGGHLLIAGSARSGRSTALRTVAASLAGSLSPSDLHLYGLDFGNGGLLPIDQLPHSGGVVMRSEEERIERLVARLSNEVAERQELLARSGLGDIAEQRQRAPAGDRLPYLVVLIDRWEAFTSQFSLDSSSDLLAAVLRLIREGSGVGLRLVVAGDRSLLSDRIASQVEDKFILRLSDRNDYQHRQHQPQERARGGAAGPGLSRGVGIRGADRPGGRRSQRAGPSGGAAPDRPRRRQAVVRCQAPQPTLAGRRAAVHHRVRPGLVAGCAGPAFLAPVGHGGRGG